MGCGEIRLVPWAPSQQLIALRPSNYVRLVVKTGCDTKTKVKARRLYVTAEAVAEELTTKHCGFYSDKKQGVVAAFFLSQIYRSWGLVAHR